MRGLEALLDQQQQQQQQQQSPLPPRLALAAFLTSASAKDASLLVRLRVRDCAVAGAAEFFLIDLDPKPLSRVAKYARQARELEEGWGRGGAEAFAAAGKACSAASGQ